MLRSFIVAFLEILLLSVLFFYHSSAQETTIILDSSAKSKTVIAGDYDRSGLHNFLFGKHYRKEWSTPVRVPIILLDTVFGGLTPYEAGGGRQSKSLKLHDKNNREYVLRSLDKSFGRALSPIYLGTFIEDLVNDQVTIGHPYAAFTIPQMAEAAKIYHTNPQIGYIPKQPALDSFNDRFGNLLYMLEQRPDENWETAANFGNSKKIIGTDKLLEKLLKDNDTKVDQLLYVRSRLFDMFIGDWSRHEDQWRWANFDNEDQKIYKPVPRDRDQAYTIFDGVFPKLVLHAANLDYLTSFKEDIKQVNDYNYTARHLDRRMANEVTYEQWMAIAKDLQQLLTDDVIERSIKQMPPEVYPISGGDIIAKLKARRTHLTDFASSYYKFLARHVDIPGTREREYFEVKRLNDNETSVKVYKLQDNGSFNKTPLYSRIFKTDETKDIRLYGIAGKDVFNVDGKVNNGINVRIIGGADIDSITDHSVVNGGARKTNVYDDGDNNFETSRETKLHLSADSANHAYNYEEFEYHKKGIKLSVFYNNPDRIYASIGYGFAKHEWRKYPYGFEQAIYLRYSISQNAFSILYEGKFHQFFGKWDAGITANYDAVRWTNFFGLGNETKKLNDTRNYYQLRTDEFYGALSVNRTFKNRHHVDLSTYFQGTEVIDDAGRYVTDNYTAPQLFYFDHHQYVGARLGYTFQDVNDNAVPTKGIMFYAGAAYTQNIQDLKKGFATYNGILQLYIPLFSKFSLSVRTGIASVSGEPEFYQYASIGGSQTLRGYKRDRFWGQTAFYNSNELRWVTDFKSYIMNGKFGLIALLDDGRVWMPGEKSNVLHYGYGGGFLLAPFNKFSVSLTYGISEESSLFHIRFNKLLLEQ